MIIGVVIVVIIRIRMVMARELVLWHDTGHAQHTCCCVEISNAITTTSLWVYIFLKYYHPSYAYLLRSILYFVSEYSD